MRRFVQIRRYDLRIGGSGSPATGEGVVSLWLKFMDRWPRHGQCAYMCLTARTLAMTGKIALVCGLVAVPVPAAPA